jgi:sec-independent protein translocase protein TatA
VVPRIGIAELIILSTMLMVFFGSKKLPEFIKGVAEGVREFKKTAGE